MRTMACQNINATIRAGCQTPQNYTFCRLESAKTLQPRRAASAVRAARATSCRSGNTSLREKIDTGEKGRIRRRNRLSAACTERLRTVPETFWTGCSLAIMRDNVCCYTCRAIFRRFCELSTFVDTAAMLCGTLNSADESQA